MRGLPLIVACVLLALGADGSAWAQTPSLADPTGPGRASQTEVVQDFDIRDLLVRHNDADDPAPLLNPPPMNLIAGPGGAPSGGGGFGGGTGGLFSDDTGRASQRLWRTQAVEAIIDSITKSVAPDSWAKNGGKIGTIRELNGHLVVNQSAENQFAIRDLLVQMREVRARQISFESRILLVMPGLLDSLAIDWNIREKAASTAPASATSASARAIALPAGVAASPTVLQSGDTFKAAILEDRALDRLRVIAQSDTQSVGRDLSRVTIFNNSRALLTLGAFQEFITAYAAGPGEGTPSAAKYAHFGKGLIVTLRPALSADLKTAVTRVTICRDFPMRIDREAAPNIPAEKGLFIDKPVISSQVGDLTLSIPDGATAVISGGSVPADFLRDLEGFVAGAAPAPPREVKVSKSPLQLFILLRPTILLHGEAESGTDLFGAGRPEPTAGAGTKPEAPSKP